MKDKCKPDEYNNCLNLLDDSRRCNQYRWKLIHHIQPDTERKKREKVWTLLDKQTF